MNILQPWNVIFFFGFIAYLTIRGVYARRTKREVKVHRQIDGLEKALLSLVISSSTLLPLVYLFTPLLAFADYRLPAFAPWGGTAIMVVALWLFWRSFVTFAPMYVLRTPREERMMCEFFGQDYRDYMGQTGRIFPRIKRRKDAAGG